MFISVLTDNLSDSMSVVLGALVQDYNIGNVVGEPSMRSPSFFAGPHSVRLPMSGLEIPWLHIYFPRPDAEADQFTLLPDIQVPRDYAINAAVEFLRG